MIDRPLAPLTNGSTGNSAPAQPGAIEKTVYTGVVPSLTPVWTACFPLEIRAPAGETWRNHNSEPTH